MTQSVEEALAFSAPPKEEVARYFRLMNRYFDPEFIGLDNIPRDKPTLFVGNHTRFGLLDTPLMIQAIYTKTGVYPRGLADRFHYTVPVWRDLLGRVGAVIGSREMCRALMDAGESILVYPGGGGEVVKGRNHDYTLLWKQRLGFVRMAVESGYSITPFSSVGADTALDPVIDGEQILASPLGKFLQRMQLLERLPDGAIPPIPRGVGLTIIPRPERFYFSFGKPIETRAFEGREEEEAVLRKLRKQTADCINAMIKDSLLRRAQDHRKQSTVRRFLQKT